MLEESRKPALILKLPHSRLTLEYFLKHVIGNTEIKAINVGFKLIDDLRLIKHRNIFDKSMQSCHALFMLALKVQRPIKQLASQVALDLVCLLVNLVVQVVNASRYRLLVHHRQRIYSALQRLYLRGHAGHGFGHIPPDNICQSFNVHSIAPIPNHPSGQTRLHHQRHQARSCLQAAQDSTSAVAGMAYHHRPPATDQALRGPHWGIASPRVTVSPSPQLVICCPYATAPQGKTWLSDLLEAQDRDPGKALCPQ